MAVLQNLVGMSFGLLTVTALHDKKSGSYRWLCRCKCGVEKVVFGTNLKRGHTVSCGCYHNPSSNPPIKDLTGHRYNKLVVIEIAGRDTDGTSRWKCLCDCGRLTIIVRTKLITGATRSCGCLRDRSTHKHSNSNTYHSWQNLKARCHNNKNPNYKDYAGRGISVCHRWLESFENFYTDMGDCPSPKHSIDRIDNDGNYEPGNCRWATKVEQCNNRRTNRVISVSGIDMTMAEAARISKVTYAGLKRRIDQGWPTLDAINTSPNEPPA